MPTDDKERDFNDSGALKRPGRIDLRLFQNIDDAGDGHPGLQKIIRNWVHYWVKYYLHDGVIEQALDMNSKDIDKVQNLDVDGNADIDGTLDVAGVVDVHSGIDMNATDIDNLKDIDGNIFYCSTEAEINTALTAIGANGGTIIIESGIITLTGTITINGGGSYIIKGQGDDTVIDCNGDVVAFTITSAEVCYIRDLKIDCSDFTASPPNGAIDVNEGSDNKVSIENVTIYGNGIYGNGIYVQSENIDIKYCDISEIGIGINAIAGAGNIKLIGNLIHDVASYGIESYSINGRIIANIIYTCDGHSGIHCLGDHSTISLNDITDTYYHGILLETANDCTLIGNTIHDINNNHGQNCCGIYFNNSDRATLSGNSVSNVTNIGGGTGIGIYVSNSTSSDCTIVGNTSLSCDTNYTDSGTGTFDQIGGADANHIA